MKILTKTVAVGVSFFIGMIVVHGAVYAQIGAEPKAKDQNNRIVGLWDVDVVVSSCANPNITITEFSAMHKYEVGGTGQVVPNTSPTAQSAHMMIWNHVRKNDYRMVMKMYRFDPNGNNIGWVIVRNETSINKSADKYIGSGVAEFFDSAGNFQFSSCPSFVGTRFTGE
jgi:hypothetical protein